MNLILFWYVTDIGNTLIFTHFWRIFYLTLKYDFVVLFGGATWKHLIRIFLYRFFKLSLLGETVFPWSCECNGPSVLSVNGEWRSVKLWWNNGWKGKAEVLGGCPVPVRATWLTINPTWTALGSNLGLQCEKPVPSRLSCGTACWQAFCAFVYDVICCSVHILSINQKLVCPIHFQSLLIFANTCIPPSLFSS